MKKIISLLCILFLLCGCKAENMNHDSKIVIALLDSGVSSSAIQSEHLLSGYNYVCDRHPMQQALYLQKQLSISQNIPLFRWMSFALI